MYKEKHLVYCFFAKVRNHNTSDGHLKDFFLNLKTV